MTFNLDHPRDEHGRFTGGGTAGVKDFRDPAARAAGQTCANCPSFSNDARNLCFRHPPTQWSQLDAAWPKVAAGDWCGDWGTTGASGSGGDVGIPEAPVDGSLYGRQDAAWAAVAAGAQGPPGPQGAAGPPGPKGDTGAQGAASSVPGPAGATGAAGPTAVSANAGNLARLGTDSLLFVPDAPGDGAAYGRIGAAWAKVVALAGGTMAGVLNLLGVTDGSNAAAGQVGEYDSVTVPVANAKAAASGININVASMLLPAGDWDVQGQVWVATTGTAARETLAAVNVTGIASWVSLVSATMPAVPAGSLQCLMGINYALAGPYLPVLTSGRVRFSLAAATTIYLSGSVTYTGAGPIGLYGFIGARRMR